MKRIDPGPPRLIPKRDGTMASRAFTLQIRDQTTPNIDILLSTDDENLRDEFVQVCLFEIWMFVCFQFC